MKENFPTALSEVLVHEGGFVHHSKDPGGATNKGVTIGTLKRIGIDVDGDGDSDLADLKALRPQDLQRVYKPFYWDAVRADLLPAGLDYAMFDFAVNAGPARAAKHMQAALGVVQDGDIGPATIAAVAKRSPQDLIEQLQASRLRFHKSLPTWKHFGKGWGRRIEEVRVRALQMASAAPKQQLPAKVGFFMWLISLFKGK